MKKRIVIIGLFAAIGGGGVAAWRVEGTSPTPQTHQSAPAVPVVAEKVQVSDVPLVRSGIGTVMPYNVVDIHTQVTGTIDKIGFVEGQTVQPGSLIAQLDPRPFQAALQQAESNLARDQAHLTNAQTNLGRFVPLAKQGYATDQQVTDQTSAVTQLQAAIIGDQAAIFNAQTQLGYTTITSPIDGVTGIRHVDIGNILQPGSTTPIVTITQIQPISVDFTLPQQDIPTVQAAMAKGSLTAIAYGQDGHTELGQGTLLLVDNRINQNSGTAQLKATFPNENRALWPGEFVNVRLTVAVRHDGITVPLSALQQGQGAEMVYVVRPDVTVQQRPVTVAQTLGGRALIDRGLSAGETVVTAGQYGLSDGLKVAEVAPDNPQVQNSTEASAGML